VKAETVSKMIIPNVDELAREHFMRIFKRSVLVLILLIMLVVLINEKEKIIQLIDHPIERMSVVGKFSYLDTESLKEHISRFVGEGFLSADLESMKQFIELLPWVYQVRVSRVWPGEINVVIEEQVAVSYWNKKGFINAQGQLFIPQKVDMTLSIPKLSYQGLLEDQERLDIFKLFQYIQQELKISNLEAIQLKQSLRGAWEVSLSNGVDVVLGQIDLTNNIRKSLDDKLERVGKLFMVKTNIALENIEKLDTRYPNGIAVQWKETLENKN
jgi:cell division protein FtsQ